MENFIVSARKYRPATFDMVVGQDTITNTLKSAIKNRHLAQAYLFCGPRGVGKTTCARIFAKTINCFNIKENGEACDKCESCLSFNSLRSFNIHELDAASNNKVEDIRSLNDQVRVPPQVGQYSIYIIDEVHMLSSSAFNAFLKTLEEPPSHAIFILATTEKHKIIPTILSRCQIFDFNRIRVEDIVNRLMFVAKNEAVIAEEDALHTIAQKADGALRDALSIFDQIVSLCGKNITYKAVIENLNVLDYEYYFKTIDAAVRGNVSEMLMIFNEILENGFDGHNFVSGLNSHLRDLLVSKDEATIRLLEAAPSVKQRYLKQTGTCSVDFLYKALEIGSNCDISYKNSKNPRLHIELSLIRLSRIMSEQTEAVEKKKPEVKEPSDEKETLPTPEPVIIKKENVQARTVTRPVANSAGKSHVPVVDKPDKSFSIRDVISEAGEPAQKSDRDSAAGTAEAPVHEAIVKNPLSVENFGPAWQEFTSGLSGEGTRIVSMFKSIVPEFEEDSKIKIHLSNAAQKDIFVLNYRQRLQNYLERNFVIGDLDIETVIDHSETNEMIYSDDQKYNYLQAKYPLLKDFKKTFNLDIS
jgi:DNA polymerase III subunit gamma/tau